jgi:hypothetical protein
MPGIRVLSSTIYNEKTICRRVPVQPVPDFEFYYFRAQCTLGFPKNGKATHLPIVQTDWSKPVASAGNISFPMFQLAIMLGCNPIGIAGVDLLWKSRQNSHFFGNGSAAGCFPFATSRVITFFREAAKWCGGNNVQAYNLSPEGVLNAFPRMSDVEFHRKFIGQVQRARICDRKFPEPQPAGRAEPVQGNYIYRHKSPAAPSRTAVHADIGQGRPNAGSSAAANVGVRTAALQRVAAIRRTRAARKAAVALGHKAQARPVQGPTGEAH